MSLPNWVSVEHSPSAEWRLVDSWWVEGASTNVFILAFNEDGTPDFNARAVQTNGGVTLLSFKRNDAGQAQADFKQSNNSVFYPDRGEVGPYSVQMQSTSDIVHGMGLPAARHFEYWLVYKRDDVTLPPPPLPSAGKIRVRIPEQIIELEIVQ